MSVIFGSGGHAAQTTPIGGSQAAIANIDKWGIRFSSEVKERVVSGGKGAKLRTIGSQDWSGSFSALGYTPIVMPGDTFTFAGCISGGGSADGKGVTGDAMCDSVEITIDLESNEPITHVVNFGPYGALTIGSTIACALDTNVPSPAMPSAAISASPGPVAISLASGGGTSFTAVNEVRRTKITIKRDNGKYVSSGTAPWKRTSQGPVDATLDIEAFAASADGWATMPQPNGIYAVKVFVTATLYYLFKWMVFDDLGGIEVAPGQTEPVGCTLKAGFSCEAMVNSTPTMGTIEKPGASQWWGS